MRFSLHFTNTSLPWFIRTSRESASRRVANLWQEFQIETKLFRELFILSQTLNAPLSVQTGRMRHARRMLLDVHRIRYLLQLDK